LLVSWLVIWVHNVFCRRTKFGALVDDTDREKLKGSEENLCQSHFIHNKLVWVMSGEKHSLGWNHTGTFELQNQFRPFSSSSNRAIDCSTVL